MTLVGARAAKYQRVSTSDQSVIRQNTENAAACEAHGWVATEYADPGLSASRFAGKKGGASRKDYSRMLADLAGGRIDVIVLWEVSRGDRQLDGWATLLDTCRRHGVRIFITSEDFLYEPAKARDWKQLAEAGISAAMESETLSLRIKSGKDAGLRDGRPQGSIAYGIHRVRDPGKTRHAFVRDEPDPVTGPVVARIIREVALGTGYSAIAGALTSDGVPTPLTARKWNGTTVTRIASNPVYASAGVVTEASSLAARARLTDTARRGERAARQTHRYSQVLRCAQCGELIRGMLRLGVNRYVCKAGHVSIRAAEVDALVDLLCIERLCMPDLIGIVRDGDSEAAAAARAEAARYRMKISEATTSYNNDRIGIETLEAITAANGAKAKAADKRALDAEIPSALAGLPDEDRAAVRARWNALTVPARKAAFRLLAPGAVALPTRRGRPAPIWERVVLWPEDPGARGPVVH